MQAVTQATHHQSAIRLAQTCPTPATGGPRNPTLSCNLQSQFCVTERPPQPPQPEAGLLIRNSSLRPLFVYVSPWNHLANQFPLAIRNLRAEAPTPIPLNGQSQTSSVSLPHLLATELLFAPPLHCFPTNLGPLLVRPRVRTPHYGTVLYVRS